MVARVPRTAVQEKHMGMRLYSAFLRALIPAGLIGWACLPPPVAAQLPSVQITSQSLPLGGLNQSYRTQLTATGGLAPYFWSLPAETAQGQNLLPPGLTLTTDGFIIGAPKTAGVYPFQVSVFASNQASGSANLQIVVIQVETASPLPDGQSNTAYSQQLTVTAGNPSWTMAGGALPGGLALSDGGLLSGTPASPGTFNFSVLATVPNIASAPAVTAQKNFQLTIISGPVGITTSSLPDGTVGVPYSQVVRAGGGTPPYTVTAADSTLPPGIMFIGGQLLTGTPTAPGSFGVQFQVRDSLGATATRTIPLNILPAANSGPLIQAQPMSLRFSAFEGSGATAPQNILVTSTAGPVVNFSATLGGASGGPPAWLTLTNQPGSTPGQLRLRANAGSLVPGTYQTSLRLVAGNQPPIDIPVVFVVKPADPQLEVLPRVIQRSSRTVSPRDDVVLVLRNTGGGGTVDYGFRVVGNSSWITRLASSPSRLSPTQPVLIRLTLDASGLKPGAYRDELRIESSLGVLKVPISLFIEDLGPALDVWVRGVRLPARQGDTPEAQRTILVRNLGGLGTVVNWTASVVRGADIFTVTPAQGSTQTGSPTPLTIGLKPNAADTPGGKAALLRISDPRSQGSPDYVVLVADVSGSGGAAYADLSPAGLSFVGVAGGAAPAAQTFQLRTSARVLNFTVAASTSDGANWLRVGAAAGSASASTPATINVSVSPGSLGAGVYTGLVTLATGSQVRSAAVTLVLLPAGASLASASSKASAEPRLAVGCTPARVAIVQTALSESFSVPAGWPATITARLLDDCGAAVPDGDLVASFSNGDAPIVLDGDGQGTYSGTWQPGAAVASATVKLDAASSTLQPATLEITGGVDVNPASPPSLVTAGLLNNLNPIVGAPLAPGTVTQVYGDNLTSQPDAPSSVPLPTQYKGVEAVIGGLSAPIYYISKNQLTVQVPSELAPNRLHSALLVTDAGYSLPVQMALVPVQPGTVAFPDGGLVAQHGNYSLVTVANPAKPNEVVTIYLVGMGATTPAVASGTAAPSAPLASVNTDAKVTVDGQVADIIFQGLTPGGVGLYQINFRIPGNARAGNLDIVISQDGITTNATKLVVGTP